MWWSLRSFAGRAPDCGSVVLTQGNWTIWFGILYGLVFMSSNAGPTFLILGYEDVEGGLWVPLWLVSFILLPLVTSQTFWLDHSRWPLLSYDDLLAFD
jgi:hypothetical protein